MRVGEVIGRVTLSRCNPTVTAGTWLVVAPLTVAGIAGDPNGREEPVIVYDALGAGLGAKIAFSEGAEASAPFHPDSKPLDAYNAAILDTLTVDPVE